MKVKLTIDIEKDLKKRFKKTVINNDVSFKSVITAAVMDYLAEFEVIE